MAISPELFRSILAMDAYNRGYNAKLQLDPAATNIGDASVELAKGDQEAEAASFFAQSYQLPSGQIIISFRGTDAPLDVVTGWVQGLGYDTAQAALAFEFYQSIVAQLSGLR